MYFLSIFSSFFPFLFDILTVLGLVSVQHCIHFDDQMSGYLVNNNTFRDSWAGIKLGGGRRTTITEVNRPG